MRRWVVVATMLRGVLDPPELLDDANSWRMEMSAAVEEGQAVREGLNWSRERDLQVTDEEALRLRGWVHRPSRADEDEARVQRMLRRAMGRVG